MAQTGYTPILIYASGTTGNTPSAANLTSSASGAELAINYFDGKLFYKDNAGVVQVLATKGTGAIGGSNTQVQYNSSGALAGSANLTFDGTTLTANALTVTNNLTLSGGTANGVLYLNGSKVATSGTDLVFNATGLGIGTSSPGTKLHVTGSNGLFVQFLNSQNNTGEGLVFGSGTNLGRISTNGASTAMAFEINAVEKMRLDSSGNLGLGVTPSAWGSVWKVVESGRTGNAFVTRTGGGRAILTSNTIFGASSDTYANTGAAAYFDIDANSFKFFTAPSGTAGNAISFTQAMTLDASGNLLVGDTANSAGARFYVKGSGATSGSVAMVVRNSTPADLLYIRNDGYTGFGLNATAMTLDASGNLGVGTTSPAQRLHVSVATVGAGAFLQVSNTGDSQTAYFGTNTSGGSIQVVGANPLQFTTNGSERARITSGGEFVIGGTSASSGWPLTLDKSTGGGVSFKHNGTDKAYIFMNGSTVSRWETVTGATIEVSSGNSNGVSLANGATSWAAISDVRLKTDLVPIQDAVNKVSSIRAVTGRFNTDDVGTSRAFLIAQDVQAVLPEAVDVADDEIKTLGLRYTDTIPLLVAAIKEQQALITALTARVAALEKP